MIILKEDEENLNQEREQIENILKEYDFDICIHIPASKLKDLHFSLRDLKKIEDIKNSN